jgi:hypothetical protein
MVNTQGLLVHRPPCTVTVVEAGWSEAGRSSRRRVLTVEMELTDQSAQMR